jgi:hypothetical protein
MMFTVAAWSKMYTIFYHLNTGIVALNPGLVMDVQLSFSVFV